MANFSTSTSHCAHCGEAATKHCAGCMNAKYCSKECLVSDRRVHKLMCKDFAAFKTPPTPEHCRAIIVREAASKPEFIWLRTTNYGRSEACGDGEDDEEPDIIEELGVPEYDPRREPVTAPDFDTTFAHDGVSKPHVQQLQLVLGNKGGGEMLDHSIFAWVREEFVLDGSDFNACLHYLSEGDTGTDWRGPIVFVGMSKALFPESCRNLDTSDLTIALNGLVAYTNNMNQRGFSHPKKAPEPKKVLGVNIETRFTEDQGIKSEFRTVAVPIKHPAFTAGIPSQISAKIGLPLATFGSIQKVMSGEGSNGRYLVGYLQLGITDKPGPIPKDQQGITETVLVVNTDKKPIEKDEVIALCVYIEQTVKIVGGLAGGYSAYDVVYGEGFEEFHKDMLGIVSQYLSMSAAERREFMASDNKQPQKWLPTTEGLL